MIVNYPKTTEGIKLLEERVAIFKATVIVESIKSLKTTNKQKKDILEGVLKKIKEESINN